MKLFFGAAPLRKVWLPSGPHKAIVYRQPFGLSTVYTIHLDPRTWNLDTLLFYFAHWPYRALSWRWARPRPCRRCRRGTSASWPSPRSSWWTSPGPSQTSQAGDWYWPGDKLTLKLPETSQVLTNNTSIFSSNSSYFPLYITFSILKFLNPYLNIFLKFY